MATKKTTTSTKTPAASGKTYAQLNAELDQVMLELEQNDQDVDNAMAAYQRGMELIKELEQYLEEAENTISKVKAQFE
jgi:exodeoxyribonuclease VII small subunit